MADIKLVADVSSIKDAKKALDRFSASSDKLGRSVMGAAKKIQSVSSGWGEANRLYKQGVINSKQLSQAQVELARELAVVNNYVKKNGDLNTQRALRELKAAQAAKESAQAAQKSADKIALQAKELNRLKNQFDSTYRSSTVYKKELRDLVKAKKAGILTTDQYQTEVSQLKKEFRDFANQTKGVSALNNRFAAQTALSARHTNHLGVVMQQAGYQIGDFAVQVQSGTNIMVALGQQLTQLVGVGAMLTRSLKWVAIFSGLGIIVPILTGIAGALMRTRGETKSLDDAVSSLSGSMEEYLDSARQADSGTKELMETYGRITPEIIELEERLQALRLRQVALDAAEVANAISNWNFGGALAGGELNDIEVTFDTTIDHARQIKRLMDDIGEAEGPEEVLAAMQALSANIIRSVGGVNKLTKEQKEFISQVTEGEVQYQRLLAVLGIVDSTIQDSEQGAESLNDKFKEILKTALEIQKAEEERKNFVIGEVTSRQDSIKLLQKELEFGADSKELTEARARLERDRYREELNSLKLKDHQVSRLMDLYDLEKGILETIRERNKEEAQASNFDEMNFALLQQLDLQKEIAQFGKQSYEVRKLLADQEIDAYNRRLNQQVESGELLAEDAEKLKLLHQQLVNSTFASEEMNQIFAEVSKAMGGAADEASQINNELRIAEGLLNSLVSKISSLGLSNIGTAARIRVLEAGGSIGKSRMAGVIAEERARLEPALSSENPMIRQQAQRELEEFIGLQQESLRLTEKERELLESTRGARGGNVVSEYDQAKNALADLIASYDETKAMALKLAKAEEVLNNAVAQGVIDFNKKDEVLEDYKKSLEGLENPMVKLGQSMKDTIGNAFMSIIDGTKTASEAFRDMARAIIKEAFRMLVIKPLMTFLFGATGGGGFFNLSSFMANGGAWRGGNVTAFADGGVVGGPTYFPMSGGRTGLMGEAGPEAIMPLKRGPDGKLGVQSSGSNITVNQTINVSTGVQQTVRTEIKSLMPQIAGAAKAAVADARRRGEMGMA